MFCTENTGTAHTHHNLLLLYLLYLIIIHFLNVAESGEQHNFMFVSFPLFLLD